MKSIHDNREANIYIWTQITVFLSNDDAMDAFKRIYKEKLWTLLGIHRGEGDLETFSP